MLLIRDPRFASALVIIGVSVFAVSRGVDLAGFAAAEMSADEQTVATRLAPWSNARGVATLARRHVLTEARDDELDAKARLAAIGDLLALAPLDGNAWAALAALRFASGAPAEKGSSALAMSDLTAPNEGWLMATRAILAVPLWRVLPPDSRRTAVNDLVGGWSEVSDVQRTALRVSLRQQSPRAREEIRAALLLAGEEAAPVVEALGLGAPLESREDAVPAASTGSAERTPAPPASATGDVRQAPGPRDEGTTH